MGSTGILVITGATATGKSDLALQVAAATGAEIISMDSRQVYRGMDVGTAKVTVTQRAAVPHHGLDLVTPDQRYSAGRFARDARRWLDAIGARGRPALLVGGTGFFLRALTHPLFAEPALDPDRAELLKRYLETLPEEHLRGWAASLQHAAASPTDRQRLSRWIEVATLTGRTLDWWHRHAAPAAPRLQAPIVVLERPRAELQARIDARVTDMVAAGLLDEVRALLDAGYRTGDPGMSATGYPEMAAHLAGESTLAQAMERTRAATRRYAKRQETWFRHQLPEHAVRIAFGDRTAALAERLAETLMGEEARA